MLRALALVTLLVALPLAAARWHELPEPDFLLGGIQVNEPDHPAWVAALEREGMNTVAVTAYAYQGDWDSANLWFDDEAPYVVSEIRAAKARGLEVVLVLRVALDHAFERNKFFWHGMVQPRSEAELDEWFARYGRFARQWAEISRQEGVDVLAVASELNSLTGTVPVADLPGLEEYWTNDEKVERENSRLLALAGEAQLEVTVRGNPAYGSLERYLDDRSAAHAAWARQVAWLDQDDPVAAVNARRRRLEAHWRGLIGEMAELYPGRLTYAANFDQFEEVGFWDALDLIGVNAYFPLRRWELPGLAGADLEAQLVTGWRRVLGGIDHLRRRRGLPDHRVLFTEIGYVARANATVEPWAAEGVSVLRSGSGERLAVWRDEPADREERALAMRALYRAHLEQGGDLLAGLLYWKLSTEPAHREVEPFVAILGTDEPLLAELRPFTQRLERDRSRRRLALLARAAAVAWGSYL